MPIQAVPLLAPAPASPVPASSGGSALSRRPPVVMCLGPVGPDGSPGSSSSSSSSGRSSLSLVDPPTDPAQSLDPAQHHQQVAGMQPGHAFNSQDYVQDVMNLSVELDPHLDTGLSELDDYSSGLEPEEVEEGEAEVEEGLTGLNRRKSSQVSEERAAARQLLSGFDALAHVGERHNWMLVLAPEQPMAEEECIIMFNRLQSEALRVRPRIQMQYSFNTWSVKAEGGANFVVELSPAPMPRSEYSDFWWARIKIPANVYELNFVLSDGEGLYENNGGQDFMFPVAEGITYEDWAEIAAEIARKAEEERLAAEKKKAEEEARVLKLKLEAERRTVEEAQKIRQEELRVEALDSARRRAEDVLKNWSSQQAVGMVSLRKGGGVDPTQPLVWLVEPEEPRAGSSLQLYYNRKATNLAGLNIPQGQSINLRWGVNGWKTPCVVPLQRCATKPARVLAEEGAAEAKDYAIKVALPAGLTKETWLEELTEEFRREELESRSAAEMEIVRREMRRREKRSKAQAAVRAVERRKVRHVLYTEPEVITAGETVTLWYNPHDTPLNGKREIFFMAGFNSWTHPSPVGPIEMMPPDVPGQYAASGVELVPAIRRSGSATHWKCSFVVPPDAYKMDFVFSDVRGGAGTYDNRGGYDYHLPVEGCPVKEQAMYVVHIAVEMAPIAKVGGLGDVVTALGRAVQEQGHQVECILPKYEFLNYSPSLGGQLKFETEYDWGGTRIAVFSALVENLRVWFIEPRNGFFQTPTVYGRYDDEVRFDFFCKAALEFLLRTNRQPDILHCHDWSTAHVAKAFWEDYQPYGLWKPKVIFTIHNLNYGQKKLAEAADYCQKFTTVSPTYAYETGSTPLIAKNAHKFCGIRNGIDLDLWDPEHNQFLPAPIVPEQVAQGKQAARNELRKRVNLSGWQDKFVVAVVSRLTPQKGVSLIKHTAFRTIERGGQFVLLGSAPDPKLQAKFSELQASMGGQDAAFQFKYDEPLSHLIYAAADIVVVPSMFEPCGLTQLIAMRYGAVPVVRHTGGLRDTVFDVDYDKARAAWEMHGSSDFQRDNLDATNGFAFEGTDTTALDYALNRAIDAWYNDRAWFVGLQRRVMEQDWSWNKPALDYIELYANASKQ
ncbi:hypothetical protein V8C86DRAFT_192634 [Haematococcus lacustris]